MALKIGFLLPSSETFPLLITDYINGFKLSFIEHKIETPEIVFEGIGNGTDASILRVAEKIIIQENIDLILGFCGKNNLEKLANIAKNYKKSFIHSDLGGSIFCAEYSNEYVIHHSQNLWQVFYFAGIYAAQEIGKRVAFLSSFYEGGYQMMYGFVKGFEQAGGEIVNVQVAKSDYKTFDFQGMLEAAKLSEPDFVFCNFTHKESDLVFNKISEMGFLEMFPIVFNPYSNCQFTQEILTKCDIFSFSNYFLNGENEWELAYKDLFKKVPNEISLLGYEAGLLAIETFQSNPDFDKPIKDVLEDLKISSPKGSIEISGKNITTFDTIVVKRRKDNCELETQKIALNSGVFDSSDLESIENEEDFGGWYNPYLCT